MASVRQTRIVLDQNPAPDLDCNIKILGSILEKCFTSNPDESGADVPLFIVLFISCDKLFMSVLTRWTVGVMEKVEGERERKNTKAVSLRSLCVRYRLICCNKVVKLCSKFPTESFKSALMLRIKLFLDY